MFFQQSFNNGLCCDWSNGCKLEEHWRSFCVHIGYYMFKNIRNVIYKNPMNFNVLKWKYICVWCWLPFKVEMTSSVLALSDLHTSIFLGRSPPTVTGLEMLSSCSSRVVIRRGFTRGLCGLWVLKSPPVDPPTFWITSTIHCYLFRNIKDFQPWLILGFSILGTCQNVFRYVQIFHGRKQSVWWLLKFNYVTSYRFLKLSLPLVTDVIWNFRNSVKSFFLFKKKEFAGFRISLCKQNTAARGSF